MDRGRTTKKMMEVDWAYPVWKPEVTDDSGETQGSMARAALPYEDAWQWIAGDDKRPLLVLREFDRIDHPDNPKLSAKLFSEKARMLAQWFHCVRLPATVDEGNHPFHQLFATEGAGNLFFAQADGSNRVDFDVKMGQADLYKMMQATLDTAYDADIKAMLREMPKLMGQIDRYDAEIQELKEAMDSEIERKGPRSPRLQRLKADLKEREAIREKLLAQHKDMLDLKLRETETAGK